MVTYQVLRQMGMKIHPDYFALDIEACDVEADLHDVFTLDMEDSCWPLCRWWFFEPKGALVLVFGKREERAYHLPDGTYVLFVQGICLRRTSLEELEKLYGQLPEEFTNL